MAKYALLLIGTIVLLFSQGCRTQHVVEVAPVKVEPIHITIDVNIRVNKAIDDFFGDIYEEEDEEEQEENEEAAETAQ